MILADTSVLIDYLKGRQTQSAQKLSQVIESALPFGISPIIYQELLQGCASLKEFDRLKHYLDTQIFYDLLKGRDSYAEAAKIYWKCRNRGVTIRSTIDCLIAQTALENNLFLLHNDVDFTRIQKVIPSLKLY